MWFKFPQLWKHFPWYDRSSFNYHKHARWEANLEYLICLFIFNSTNMHVSSKMQHIKLSHFPPTLPFVLFFFFVPAAPGLLFCAAFKFLPCLGTHSGMGPGAGCLRLAEERGMQRRQGQCPCGAPPSPTPFPREWSASQQAPLHPITCFRARWLAAL